eukprot:5863489-Amphidinium_carterae.1
MAFVDSAILCRVLRQHQLSLAPGDIPFFVAATLLSAATSLPAVQSYISRRLTTTRTYSLRTGGATCDFLRHGSMETTLLKGRWASSRTARLHLASAALAYARLTLTDTQTRRLTDAALALVEAVEPMQVSLDSKSIWHACHSIPKPLDYDEITGAID